MYFSKALLLKIKAKSFYLKNCSGVESKYWNHVLT
jgi:hypothetical protein